MKSSRANSHMGGGKSKGKKSGSKPHSMHVKRAKSGGFIVTHHHQPDEAGLAQESEDHVVPDMQSLQDHMQSNMGDQPAAPMTPPAAAAGPAGGAPAGM